MTPEFSLTRAPRCSSEELLDRLFKKSVVTEVEVTLQPELSATNRLACVPVPGLVFPHPNCLP